jgi:heme/copper-type cytochrome/quinol oxidase subunit 4
MVSPHKRLTIFKQNAESILKELKRSWGVLALCTLYVIFASLFLGTGCLFASTTGFPCIGCGGTRAAFALMHGDITESLRFHPLLIPAAILFGSYVVVFLFWGKEKADKLNKALVIFTIAAVILFVVRMILFFPHTEPMKYNFESVAGRIFLWITNLL